MGPIEPNSVLTFVSCFVILLMALYVIAYFLVRWGVRQLKNDRINEAEYEAMYSNIQKHIEKWPVDLSIYYKIKQEIWRLENLKWKNKEKTGIIALELCSGRFLNIALAERKKRIEESY